MPTYLSPGIYNEKNLSKSRGEWSHPYTGFELMYFARCKCSEYKAREKAAREQMARLAKDPETYRDDRDLQALKDKVDRIGALRERLEVYSIAFEHQPEREFSLKLSDVMFFDLHLAHTHEGLLEILAMWRQAAALDLEHERLISESRSALNMQERLSNMLARVGGTSNSEPLKDCYVRTILKLHKRIDAATERAIEAAVDARDLRRVALQKLSALDVPEYRIKNH